MARPLVLARTAVALLAALALLAAAALAQPVANSVDPPSWLPPVGVPASGSVYQTLYSPKVWSDSCTVSYYGPSSATVSWTNSSSVYFYPGWSALLFLTEPYNIYYFAVRCALSSPTFIALKPRYQLPSGASGWIALIANATTLGQLSSCSVGASALGGKIVACIPVTGTGSIVEVGSWYNISYVSSFAIYISSSTAGLIYIGGYIDISKLVWLSGPPPASTGRRPVYQAVFNVTGTYASALPQPSDAWRRPGYTLFLYGLAPPSSIQPTGSLTFWYILDAPANVTVRHAYADGSVSAGASASPRSYVFDEKQPAWANFSSTDGWLKVVAPQQGEELKIAAPAGNAIPVTFFVNDYGQGYTHLVVYTLANRLAWRDEISSATRSAVAYLVPYGNYILALRKPGEERVLGPVTVSQTQYSLTVLPQLQPAPPPSTAVVYYNSSLPGYVVDVSCTSPPCTITLTKREWNATAQQYAVATTSYTCTSPRCRFTWITSDPFLEASVADAAGSTYVVISGTSLPQQPGGLPGLADLINWLAGSTGLGYLAGPGAAQAFLVALGSVLLLIAFSTAGSWEFGLLAAAAGLVLLPILLGAPPLAIPAGLVIALAALSLMLRKERED